MRRAYFLGDHGAQTNSNLDKRIKTNRNRYFAHQLLDHESQQFEMQDGEEEAEYGDYLEMSRKRSRDQQFEPLSQVQQHSMAQVQGQSIVRAKQSKMRKIGGDAPGMQMAAHGYGQPQALNFSQDFGIDLDENDEEVEDGEEYDNDALQSKRPMEAKQSLLHLVSTEIIVNTRLHGELTCIRTVFNSWNPLLPHETILTVLEYFGISAKWRSFFTKFLQAPLKFEDDLESEPRLRRRGAPGSHSLSDVLGEITLFCLDYAVNQATDGALLHRLYDDVWFWNKDYKKCVDAWESILTFSETTGVQVCIVELEVTHIININ